MDLSKLKAISSVEVAKRTVGARDRGELAELDLSSTVDYPDDLKVNKSEGNSLPISIRLPSGSLVNGKRVILSELQAIKIHPSNPRGDDDPELRSLVERLKKTNGNITPVVCRDKNGRIELISGTRRLKASIIAGTLLLADIITDEISDNDCEMLADVENSERDDPDVWSTARSFGSRFALQQSTGRLSVGDFAQKYNLSRQNMSDYLNLSKIPGWLLKVTPRYILDEIKQSYVPAWSLRQAVKLKSLLVKYREDHEDDQHFSELQKKINGTVFATVNDLLKFFSKNINENDDLRKNNNRDVIHNNTVIGTFAIGKRKKTIDLRISDEAPEELKNELLNLLAKYGVVNE